MPIDQRSHVELDRLPGESGQSIVLVALAFVGLLGVVALAVDVGLAFVRSAQFTAAVDAASLAAVVDMDPQAADTVAADVRAEQFLGANGWPVETLTEMRSARSLDAMGIPNYTLTVTWPVEFYFARVLGFESTELTRSATAANYSQAEMLTTSAAESGQVRKTSQFIYGPEACTFLGDPIVPGQSTVGVPNASQSLYDEVYRYRISVTEAYTLANRLRIELFDPDSYNSRGNSAQVVHSNAVEQGEETLDCSATTAGMGDRCILATGESLVAVNQNPIWLQRVDENWKPDCTRDAGNQFGNVVTNYTLYYLDQDGARQELASYTVDNLRDALNSDLRWVSPGAPGSVVPADSGSFEVDLSPIPLDETGARAIQMEVSAISGSAKNVWDLWAGPPAGYYASIGLAPLSADVNQRNLQLANNPTFYDTRGISVLALGRMPVTPYHGDVEIKLPLAPVEAGLGGGTAYATLFDYDAATRPPLHFTFDTVAESSFDIYATIVPGPDAGRPGTAADPLQMACKGGVECDNTWLTPQAALPIPEEFFLGGTLEANYTPGRDDHVWSLAITAGRPFLTR